jgi:lysyl-tRNA synthetase class 2
MVLTTIASVSSEFDREIVDTGKLAAFLFFLALAGTCGFIRMSTHMIRAQVKWWPGNVSVGGTHVHHLVWGIFAMMIFGYIGVAWQPDSPWREITAVFFGIGAGLTLDEFALWLELKDVYWEKQGRKSVDAMIIAICLAGMAVVGFSIFVQLADAVEGGVIAAVGAFGVVGIVIALVNAAKEKFWMALLGLVFWPAAAPAAVRLAKPHSIWARALYRDDRILPHGARKLERSRMLYGEAEAAAGPEAGDGPAAEPAADVPSPS